MSDNKKQDLINNLTKLVQEYVQDGLEPCSSQSLTSVEDTVRRLYPSTRSNGSARFSGKKRQSKISSSQQQKPESSTSSKKKYSYIIKDIFLINDPTKDLVPRRNGRQFYYENNLVATAVKLDNSMSTKEIETLILSCFPKLRSFNYLKVVDESLIRPQHVNDWNYEIIKHVAGPGPIYIRSEELIDVFDDEEVPDPTARYPHLAEFPCRIPEQDDQIEREHQEKFHSQATTDTTRNVTCPICFSKFPVALIEEHASNCKVSYLFS